MLPPTLLFWTPVVFGTLELVEILFIEFLFLIWILLSLKKNFHQFSRRLSESIIFQEKKIYFLDTKSGQENLRNCLEKKNLWFIFA